MADNSEKALSEEDKKAITDGANWLSEWMTERYNQGFLSKNEYTQAMDNLKNVKVYTTHHGLDRLIVALEKGELHFSDETIKEYSKAYEQTLAQRVGVADISLLSAEQKKNLFASLGDENLSKEQQAVAFFKQNCSSSEEPLGFHLRNTKEANIFLDVDRIKQKSEDGYFPSLTSVVVHELTHSLRLTNQEKHIQQALYGYSIARERRVPDEKMTACTIHPEFVADPEDFSKYFTERKQKKDLQTEVNPGIRLNEGVEYQPYLDNNKEVYARLMQLRYDFGLKPDESFSMEQINEIERRAQASKQKYKDGDTAKVCDIDFLIVSRYTKAAVRKMLNWTAEDKNNAKGALKVQEWQSKRDMARVDVEEKPAAEQTTTQTRSDNSAYILNRGRDYS